MFLRRINLVLIALLCIQFTDLAYASGSDSPPDEPINPDMQQYQQLALNGDAGAQFKMGTHYLQVADGIVSVQNLALAEKWFRLSAQQGHLSAMLGLAYVLNKKAKTVEDEIEIAAIYERAAQKGHEAAQYSLAMYILNGKANLKRDIQTAVGLLERSARQDFPKADMVLIDLAHHQECDPEIGHHSLERLKFMASKGDLIAQYYMGKIYENGYIVGQNYHAAMRWYKKSAAQNYSYAYIKMGSLYESGSGTAVDYKTAMQYYQTAVDLGNFEANRHIARLYEKGLGMPIRHDKAVEHYSIAAKYGDIFSMSRYGIMLAQGRGIEQNNTLAAEWLTKAASRGDAEAQYFLGKMYKKGLIYVEPDERDRLRKWLKMIRGKYHDPHLQAEMRMAKLWLTKAADQGHQAAIKELEQDSLIESWFFLIFGILTFPLACALFKWPHLFSKGYHPAIIRYLSAPVLAIMSIMWIIGGIMGW